MGILLSLASFVFLLPAAAQGAGTYVIRNFDVIVQPFDDATFEVRERVEVDFGQGRYRGITRSIPRQYAERGFDLRYRFLFEEALADHRKTFRVEKTERSIRVEIGEPVRTVSGTHVYYLFYRIDRGIRFLDNQEELVWNVTGYGHRVPIESASLQLELPFGIAHDDLRVSGFAGLPGSDARDFSLSREPTRMVWNTTRPLLPGEGFTIIASFPKGTFRKPSLFQPVMAWWENNGTSLLVFWLPPVVMMLLGALWWRRRQAGIGES